MITIDFSIFIEQEDIFDVFNLLKRTLKAFFTFNDYESMLNSDLINFKNTHFETNLTNKQIEFIEFKIENSENLFHLIYSKYEKLKNFSTEEKLKMSGKTLFELLRKTNLSNIQIFKLHNRFLNDYKEYLVLETKMNKTKNNKEFKEKIIDLSKSIELKNIFKNQELFNKMDFKKLKDNNIIYNQYSSGLEFKNRAKSDVLILIFQLSNLNLINLKHGNNYQEQVLNILSEIFNEGIDKSRISVLYNAVINKKIDKFSKYDEISLNEITFFINQFKN